MRHRTHATFTQQAEAIMHKTNSRNIKPTNYENTLLNTTQTTDED